MNSTIVNNVYNGVYTYPGGSPTLVNSIITKWREQCIPFRAIRFTWTSFYRLFYGYPDAKVALQDGVQDISIIIDHSIFPEEG